MSIGIHISKNSHVLDLNHKTMLDSIKVETKVLNLSACQIFIAGRFLKGGKTMKGYFERFAMKSYISHFR